MNKIYISNISLIGEKTFNEEKEYICNINNLERETYKGYLTNEAPLKYELSKNEFNTYLLFCTKEVLNQNVKNLMPLKILNSYQLNDNEVVTTFDYFKCFLKSVDKEIDNKTLVIAQCDDDNVEPETYKEILDNISSCFDEEKANFLTVDYTGGSRIPSMIMMLFPYTLDYLDVKVEEIVYANMNKKPYAIIELTKVYDFLSKLETNKKTKMEFINNSEIINEIKEADKVKQDNENNFDIDKDDAESKKIINKLEEAGKSIKKGKLDKITLKHIKNETKVSLNKTSFQKIIDSDTSKKIKNFRESIVAALIESKIIDNSNDKKKNVQTKMEAEANYFENKHNGGIKGFCLDLINELYKNNNLNPKEEYEKRLKIKPDMSKVFTRGVSKNDAKEFIEQVSKEDFKVKNDDDLSMEKWFEEYCGLLFGYSSIGFPYLCRKDYSYKDIRKHYLEKVGDFFDYLNEIKRINNDEYKKRLKEYIDNIDKISEKIPYCFTYVKVNNDIGLNEKEFIYELSKRIETVRPYRNSISHNDQVHPYCETEEREKIAKQIDNWVKEYIEVAKKAHYK